MPRVIQQAGVPQIEEGGPSLTGILGRAGDIGLDILETISIPFYGVSGSLLAGIKGDNIFSGIAAGVREKADANDILNELERQGVLDPDMPLFGSESGSRWVGNLALGIGLDPLTYAGGIGLLGKAGRSKKAISALTPQAQRIRGTLSELKALPKLERAGRAKQIARLEKTLGRTEKALSKHKNWLQRHAFDADLPLAPTRAEQIRRGERRFFFIGQQVAPEASAAAARQLGRGVETAKRIGGKVIPQPIQEGARKAAQTVFERSLTPTMRNLRLLRTLRRGEINKEEYQALRRALKLTDMQRKLTDNQVEVTSDLLRRIYVVDQPYSTIAPVTREGKEVLEQIDLTPGDLVKIQFPTESPVSAVDVIDMVKRGDTQLEVTIAKPGPLRDLLGDTALQIDSGILKPQLAVDVEHPLFRKYIAKLDSEFSTVRELERAAGLLEKAVPGYFPTILNRAFLERFDNKFRELAQTNQRMNRIYSTYITNSKPGKLQRFSIPDLNRTISENWELKKALDDILSDESFLRELSDLDPDTFGSLVRQGESIYINNPALALWIRKKHSIRRLANHHYIERALDAHAIPIAGKRVFDLKGDRKPLVKWLVENDGHGIFVPAKQYAAKLGVDGMPPEVLQEMEETGLKWIRDYELRAMDDEALEALSGTKVVVLPNEVKYELEKSWKLLNDPKELAGLLGVWNGAMNFFRRWTLLPILTYHTRNSISNMILLWQAGAGHGSGLVRAASLAKMHADAWKLMIAAAAREDPRILRYVNGLENLAVNRMGRASLRNFVKPLDEIEFRAPTGVTIRGDELWDMIEDTNIRGSGFTAGDLGRAVRDDQEFAKMLMSPDFTMKDKMNILKRADNAVGRAGRNVGQLIEDAARITLLMDRILKGDDKLQALEWVMRRMFFFDEMSKFDRIARNVTPFWMWKKFNIPMQVEYFLKRPDRISPIMRAFEAFQSGAGPTEENARLKWIRENHGIAMKRDEETGDFLFLDGSYTFPMFDLQMFQSFRKFFDTMASDMAPPIQAGFEQVTNQSLFTGVPLNLEVPAPQTLGPVTELTDVTLPGDIGGISTRRFMHLLNSFLPLRVFTEYGGQVLGLKLRPEEEERRPGPVEALGRLVNPMRPIRIPKERLFRSLRGELFGLKEQYQREIRRLVRLGLTEDARKLREKASRHLRQETKRLRQVVQGARE